MMTVDQMREKLLEWNPQWNVWRLTDQQVIVIYNKERIITVNAILEKYGK